MFPSFVANLDNLHDYFTLVLAGSGHNFRAHGPPGTGMRFFAAIFDIMGGSLFTIDGETSRRLHAKAVKTFSDRRLVGGVAAHCRNKVEHGLVPFLAHLASTSTWFDVQELMGRCMFDLTILMVFGVDPGLMLPNMPSMDVLGAMDTVMELGLLRSTMPVSCWKAMRLLNLGPERKLHAAHRVLHGFVDDMMERWKINNTGRVDNDEEQEGVQDVMSDCVNDPLYGDYEVLHATLIASMLAGRDTTSVTLTWILYNLAQNPDTVSMIRHELSPIASRKAAGAGKDDAVVIFEPDETKSLAYLRAALYETLRLHPPGPFETKTVAFHDIMPSGHEVHAGDTVFISLHSMGRMEGLWGKDCHDYKPERWLSEDSHQLRSVPSHKFLSFNSGPRTCPGKEIAVMQMKTIVAAVVWNFDMEVVEGQSIQPKKSCLLQMKNGLKMKFKKREM